jgi:Skp family chaperone for outer membrane proteins
MKSIKKTVVLLAVFAMLTGASAKSYAGGTAIVDIDKIRENYSAAQELEADLKVKENELQNFITNAQKQIEEAKTPVEKKNLQDKLGEQFNIKRTAFAKDQAEKLTKIETDVLSAISTVATTQKYDLVLNKQIVLFGGTDISSQVLEKLNKTGIKK